MTHSPVGGHRRLRPSWPVHGSAGVVHLDHLGRRGVPGPRRALERDERARIDHETHGLSGGRSAFPMRTRSAANAGSGAAAVRHALRASRRVARDRPGVGTSRAIGSPFRSTTNDSPRYRTRPRMSPSWRASLVAEMRPSMFRILRNCEDWARGQRRSDGHEQPATDPSPATPVSGFFTGARNQPGRSGSWRTGRDGRSDDRPT